MLPHQENTQVSDKIAVTLKGCVVVGLAYQKDARNRVKYLVYQYAKVITE